MPASMSFQPSFSSSSSSSSNHPPTYHVFLSFRGKDTRTNFTAHLYEALRQKGINTFIDDKLESGEEISPTLLETIEKSKISIIVFSKTYASSSWCLEELVKILDCRKTNNQHVLPLFYNVDPSEVRRQTNSIQEGLVELEKWYDKNTVQRWRTALTEAADLSGMHLGSRKETEFIRDIIQRVNLIIGKKTYIQVAPHPVVGIESPVKDLISLLNIEKIDSSYMVGIFGYSGIGKTTIAKCIYNSIASSFEGICFLEDIRETCHQYGMIYLQDKLLSMILGDPSPKVNSVAQGSTLIKDRLCRLRVLIVLDDVNSSDQLVQLAGNCDWFGSGSRIIITTRHKHLLTKHDVQQEHQFQVKELDDVKALQLFSLIVFNRDKPDSDYGWEVAKDVVCYSEGLPLALTELALVLKGKVDDICFCRSKLAEFKKTPYDKIQERLEVSYDGLDPNAKNIFRHMACFFKGEDVEYVKTILDICGFCSYSGFVDLKDNCLINDQSSGSLVLHGLLQEMGRQIVRKESPNEPGKRSRLWFHDDVCSVVEDKTGTNSVEGIVIDLPKAARNRPRAFAKMKRLRLFISHDESFSVKLHSLPNELRFLYWRKYTKKSLPSNFRGSNLVDLRMPYGRLKRLKGIENFESLTMMDLSNCTFLKEVPDVSRMLKLTTLILDDCVSLVKVHHSVGVLDQLVYLSLRNCNKLSSFLESLQLRCLESLVLNGCKSLTNFPRIGCRMERLANIDCRHTGIEKLPSSIENLIGVKQLFLSGCTNLTILPDSIYRLQHLEQLDLEGCSKVKFPDDKQSMPSTASTMKHEISTGAELQFSMDSNNGCFFKSFPKLRNLVLRKCSISKSNFFKTFDCGFALNHLDLSGTDIVTIPSCIKRFVGLKFLYLKDCKQLREISKLPSKIEEVYAHGCSSLERFQFNNIYDLPALQWIDLSDCNKMHEYIRKDVESRLLSEGHPEDYKFVCMFPGHKIPDWFSHSEVVSNSSSCEIAINELAHLNGDITRIALCVVIGTKADIPDVQDEIIKGGQYEDGYGIIFKVINDGVEIYSFMEDDIPGQFHSDHVWFQFVVPKPFEFKGDNFRVTFELRSASMLFKSCGFHLVRRSEEIARDLMDGVQLSKRCRGDDDDGNFPQQKRHSSTLGIRISDDEKNDSYTNQITPNT